MYDGGISFIMGPTPRIYLAAAADVMSIEVLELLKIDAALCCTTEHETPDPPWVGRAPVQFKRVALLDHADVDLQPALSSAFEFIDRAAQMHLAVVVYCQKGISRSPTIVIAYLMSRFGTSFETAFDLVRRKRPMVDPNAGFCAQLRLHCPPPCSDAALLDVIAIDSGDATLPITQLREELSFASVSLHLSGVPQMSRPGN